MVERNAKLKIGITGQQGFIGTHLSATLRLYPEKFEIVPFEKNVFDDIPQLDAFIRQCDVLVHLAAKNRHNDAEVIYKVNLDLVQKIIASCERNNSKPHVIFASSTQEDRDTIYGKSKKEGRLLIEDWAKRNNAPCTGLIIPNVFGAFGKPYFNSVIATFCHQLCHDEKPSIDRDADLKLIYVQDLVATILAQISQNTPTGRCLLVPPRYEIKVSEILAKLEHFKSEYFGNGTIPDLTDELDKNLFLTFLTYIDHKTFFPFKLKQNSDERGSFVETMRVKSGGQASFSSTVLRVTRGNHFHTRKIERFAVIKGSAKIELRRVQSTEVLSFELHGRQPSFVDMPIWHTHNITNIGSEELLTLFWCNEIFDPHDPDTYFEAV